MSNRLQNKLSHYEVSPPESVWNNISSSLDEEITGTDKLYNFEEMPSPFVWNKLANHLDDDLSGNKVIPFFKRYHKPLRFISAAAIIAVVAITVTLFVNKDALSDELVYQPVDRENAEPLKLNENITENSVEKKKR